jgi:hypothetical protein
VFNNCSSSSSTRKPVANQSAVAFAAAARSCPRDVSAARVSWKGE